MPQLWQPVKIDGAQLQGHGHTGIVGAQLLFETCV
jgi:hypothetical protein